MLKEVNSRFYNYFDENCHLLFTFNYGERGIYGNGKAWYLNVSYAGGDKIHIATFTTKSDGYNCHLKDYGKCIWDDNDALEEANKMVKKFLENRG